MLQIMYIHNRKKLTSFTKIGFFFTGVPTLMWLLQLVLNFIAYVIKLIHQITKNERDIDIKFMFSEKASKMETIHLTLHTYLNVMS